MLCLGGESTWPMLNKDPTRIRVLGAEAVVMLTVFVMALPIANMFCLLGGAWHLRSKEPDTAAAWQFLGCRG